MTWSKIYNWFFTVVISLTAFSCALYRFTSTSLNKEVKNFSIKPFQSKVALGPTALTTQLSDQLRAEVLAKTSLQQVESNGDIQFEGTITEFKYTPTAPRITAQGDTASRTQLTMSVEINYSNRYDKEFEFSKKLFNQSTDIDATANIITEEPKMVEEILAKLVHDIVNASIANW
jgi:hypothetical protein